MSTYTIGALIVLPVAGGFIAWAGDVIGYRLGKRRSSLFGLRPRTTARGIGVAVGVILPVGGLAVAAAGSEYVRIALFQIEDLRDSQASLTAKNRDLQQQVRQTEGELSQAQQQTEEAVTEAKRLTEAASQAEEDLQQVQGQLDGLKGEYTELEKAHESSRERLVKTTARLGVAQHEIDDLEITERTLASNIGTLNGQISELNTRTANLRDNIAAAQEELETRQEKLQAVQRELAAWQWGATTGPLAFEQGDEIIRAVIDTDQTRAQIESSLTELLFLASKEAARRKVQVDETGRAVRLLAPAPPEESVRQVSEESIVRAVAGQIRRSEQPSFVVSIRVLARAFEGQPEPVWVGLGSAPNRQVYRQGETIVTVRIDGSAPRAKVFQDLWSLLSRIRRTSQDEGILPVPGTGQYGEVPAEEVLATLDSLLAANRVAAVDALAAQDVYTANQQPFVVTLHVQ